MEVLYLYSLLKEKLIFEVVSELTQTLIRLIKMTLWGLEAGHYGFFKTQLSATKDENNG